MRPSGSGATWRADAALASITLIWGATFVVVKQALEHSSTLLFLALRFSLATLALVLAFRRRWSALFERQGTLRGGVVAGLCLFGGYLFQTLGLRHTTPSKSAFLTGLSVVLVPFLGAIVYRKRPRLPEILGVAVATAGMGLLTLEDWDLRMGAGDLATLGCAFAFAVHVLVLGHYSRRVDFAGLSLAQIATAALIALGTCWWVEAPRVAWRPSLLLALVVTGLLATALAFTVQSWAQQHTTPTRTALILALEPVFAAITSFVVVGEVLSRRAALGAALILAGIVVVELNPHFRFE